MIKITPLSIKMQRVKLETANKPIIKAIVSLYINNQRILITAPHIYCVGYNNFTS